MLRRLSVAASLFVVPALAAQNRTDARIALARAHITAHEFSAADTALSNALDSAAYLMDSVHVFVWRAILEHQRGSDSLARQSFRSALVLYPALRVNGLDQVAPGLDAVFESELRSYRVYAPAGLDDMERMIVRPNLRPDFPADRYEAKVARWQSVWPELTVFPVAPSANSACVLSRAAA